MTDPGDVRFEKPGLPGGVQFEKAGGAIAAAQYAQPDSVIAQEPGPTYELASWGRRALAALIDGFIVMAVLTIVGVAIWQVLRSEYPIGWGFDDPNTGEEDFVRALLLFLAVAVVALVVSLTYAPIWMWRTNGRTIGKQLLGIRVVRADGFRMTFGFAVYREFLLKGLLGAVASSFTLYLYALADALWPLWDSEHRAIHDHIARTRVVRD